MADLIDVRPAARAAKDADEEAKARCAVDIAKQALGGRGSVWWDDGALDQYRKMAKNSTYADWFAAQGDEGKCGATASAPLWDRGGGSLIRRSCGDHLDGVYFKTFDLRHDLTCQA